MKKRTAAGAALALGLLIPQVLPSLTYAEVMQNDSVVKLKILETSDIHVNLADYDYYQTKSDEKLGLARTATLIKQVRSSEKNTLLFDNGDMLQGNPLGDYIYKENRLAQGDHPAYRVMNLLQYDGATVGNHEFNYGLPFLNEALKGAQFPIVNANVYKDDGDSNLDNDVNYFTPYKIIDKEVTDENGNKKTLKVGVIGFVPPQITVWDKANLEGKVIAKDIVKSAEKFIPKMKAEGADLIIALSHSGMGASTYVENAENVSSFLTTIPGIDAVLTGHSHDNKAEIINGVPVTMPGSFGSALGVIDLELHNKDGKWTVNKEQSKANLLKIYDSTAKVSLAAADAEVLAAIEQDHQGTIDYVNQEVGVSTAPINSYFALVQDDPSVQLVTNAQKEYVEKWLQLSENSKYAGIPVLSAGAPFKAGGRNGADYYTDIAAGKLMIKNMADLYVYPNTLYAVQLTGADVKEWLEMSAGQFNQIDVNKTDAQELINTAFPTYNFDVLDGVNYEIDVTQPAKYDKDGNVINAEAQRITNLTYNGQPIPADQKFIVATNNYRGSSKTFPGVKNSTAILKAPDENRQIIVNYIQDKKVVNPTADRNWSFKMVNSKTLQVMFDSSPKAQKYVTGQENLAYVGDSATTGFARYAVNLRLPEAAPVTEAPAPEDSGQAGSGTTTPVQTGATTASTTEAVTQTKAATTAVSNSTASLPDTATNMFTMLAAGLVAIAAGAFTFIKKRRKA